MHDAERTDFPICGARARQWRRFEDGLRSWLESPEGRFHAWDAQRRLEREPAAASSSAE
ncbi:MAG TPA: hypothetical protein VIL49_09980 [Capillimicrobium sp.]|jgi:hypothetical protein